MATDDKSEPLRSFRELPLTELGGIYARRGFHLQDHIAAKFSIRMMLRDSGIAEIWCETLDDVLIVWRRGLCEEIEFIQVKAECPDQLWTTALICQRVERRDGTSLIEKSLARDCAAEVATFRIVTSRQVAPELRILTESNGLLPRPAMLVRELEDGIRSRLGDVRSTKSHDVAHWLQNCVWDEVPDVDSLQRSNILRLMEVLDELAELSTPDRASELYMRLLRKVNDASLATDRAAKVLRRTDLISWLLDSVRAAHLGEAPAGVVARQKMDAAGLDVSTIESALQQRRFYRLQVLRPKYLKMADVHVIDAEVTARLQSLRAQLEAETLHDSGVEFHQRCLNAIADLHVDLDSAVPLPVLQGCMYDLTDRCLHRFIRASA